MGLKGALFQFAKKGWAMASLPPIPTSLLSGGTNIHWRNHVVQNLRAHFILYIIIIKCIKCKQEKNEFSCMLQRPRLLSTKTLEHLSLATKIKQQ